MAVAASLEAVNTAAGVGANVAARVSNYTDALVAAVIETISLNRPLSINQQAHLKELQADILTSIGDIGTTITGV